MSETIVMNNSEIKKPIKIKKILVQSSIFTVIGIISGVILGMMQLNSSTEEMIKVIEEQLGSADNLIIITTIQTGIFAFISSILGLILAQKVNLQVRFKNINRGIILAIIVGVASSAFIILVEKFFFLKYLPEQNGTFSFNGLYFASSLIYGGIIEEVMLRLFFISLLVWLGIKIFRRKKEEKIPDIYYIFAIIISALFFAAGHLPATAITMTLTVPIILRAFVLNGVVGLGFGYLYWKHGLAAAILAHMLTHVFNQLVFMPIFFG